MYEIADYIRMILDHNEVMAAEIRIYFRSENISCPSLDKLAEMIYDEECCRDYKYHRDRHCRVSYHLYEDLQNRSKYRELAKLSAW